MQIKGGHFGEENYVILRWPVNRFAMDPKCGRGPGLLVIWEAF